VKHASGVSFIAEENTSFDARESSLFADAANAESEYPVAINQIMHIDRRTTP